MEAPMSASGSRSEITDSEVLLGALPALLRAADQSSGMKAPLFEALRYWCNLKEDRNRMMFMHTRTTSLIDAGIKNSQTDDERGCLLRIIERGQAFAPAEFLLG